MAISGPLLFGKDFCEALGMDPDITSRIDLSLDVSTVPVVVFTQYIRTPNTVATVLRRYQLVPMPSTRLGRLKLRIVRKLVRA